MDAFVVIALIGVALLLTELLLPTGGTLALLGAAGMIVAGIEMNRLLTKPSLMLLWART